MFPLKCNNNGYFSEEFKISRGVRQGCPVSSLLFVLCMEVLANSVRQNIYIKGLSFDENANEHAKIIQYADDTTLFLRNTHEMREAINLLEHFGSVSGTQLNLEKCEGLWIGSYKNRQDTCSLHNMKWPRAPIRYLGVYVTDNVDIYHHI